MEMLDRIGFEREFWLLDIKDNKIVEPSEYGFPSDEFGFLVEIRTHPHTTARGLLDELNRLTLAHKAQAEALGLRLHLQARRFLGKSLKNCLKKKYAWDSLPDLTANVYEGITTTHATGIDGLIGTAGLHVHFSRHDEEGRRMQLPIPDIVYAMDAFFGKTIAKANRVCGEFEIKPHGFEYRSLPATVDIEHVAVFTFTLFKTYPYIIGIPAKSDH